MSKADLRIDWATHAAAKFACERWHYSKSVPVPPLVKIGAWESGKFIGVVIFSRGASSNLMKPYGLKQSEGCELTRVALTTHEAPVSRIVRLAMLFLKKNSPELRLIVSFADPNYGHHGGIYQAGNWLYLGDTASGQEYWHNGRRLHSRQVSEKGWNIQQGVRRKTVKPSECKIVRTPGKHRYAMPLDADMRALLAPRSKPYPKSCARSIDSDAPGDQPGEGGASPTRALQSAEG